MVRWLTRSFRIVFDTGKDIQTHEREIAPGSDAKLRFAVKVTGETFDLEDAANDAVTTAGSALTRMDLRPALSKPAEVVEGGKAVVEAVNAVGEAVSPISGFLDGLGIFCEIMDDITEVRTGIDDILYNTQSPQRSGSPLCEGCMEHSVIGI